MARTKPRTERLAELLDATEQLILRHDVTQLTVEDITTAAGVSKGTFYLYFATKDDALGVLRERYATRLLSVQAAAADELAPADWAGRLETWLVAGIEEHIRDPRLHNALFHHVDHHPVTLTPDPEAPTAPSPNTQVEALTAILESGRKDGAFTVTDPLATAVLLFGAAHHAADYLYHAADPALTARVLMGLRHWCRRLTT